ncbi:MAG TPA: hypothetical protein VEY08_09785, partial [Chloroflexia bacterium]|nr:hypothetical protein [Chloroflexia bacterium]
FADGKWRWVQYFEKAILEYHPDLPDPNRFQVASLGSARFSQKYPSGTPPPKALPGGESYTFAETGHTVSGPFLRRWHEGGELRRFGYPVSEAFEEVSAANGQPYIVQYFERAVMEYHPEEKPPYDVQLVALGSVRLAEAYPDGVPRNAANPIPAPTEDPAIAWETANTIRYIATSTAIALRVEATSQAIHIGAQATATYKAETGYVENRITAVALTAEAQGSGGCTTQVRIGATCRDGTSSSATGRGACSHHGGVRQWRYGCP